MHVHLVFVTKYRREVFTKEMLGDLSASVCADFEAELVEFDGEDDHAHLLVNYPPTVAVLALANSMKVVSSRVIHKKNYPSARKKRWRVALWSPSYFAGSCGGPLIEIIRQYIEQQQTPHLPPQRTPAASALSFPGLKRLVASRVKHNRIRIPNNTYPLSIILGE